MKLLLRMSLLLSLVVFLRTPLSLAADLGSDEHLGAEKDSSEQAIEAQSVPVWCLDFSPDGAMLAAAAGHRDSTGLLKVWNTVDWNCDISVTEDRAVTCVAFSPDGKSLAFGTQKGEFALLDIPTQKITARWESGKWAVYGVTWTPDGQQIVGACANGLINVWDAKSRELQISFDVWQADGITDPGLRSHGDRNQWDVTVTTDGKTLLSGGWNDTTRLWSLETRKLIRGFNKDDRSTQGVKLMPDERHFVSAGLGTGRVRIRETQSFRERMTLPVAGRDVAVHPDGQLIAASTEAAVKMFRVDLRLPTPTETLRARAFIKQLSSDDASLNASAIIALEAMGSCIEPILYEALQLTSEMPPDQLQVLWEKLRTPAEVGVLNDLHGEVRQVVFAPTGRLLAASTLNGEVKVWNVPELTLVRQFDVTIPGGRAPAEVKENPQLPKSNINPDNSRAPEKPRRWKLKLELDIQWAPGD